MSIARSSPLGSGVFETSSEWPCRHGLIAVPTTQEPQSGICCTESDSRSKEVKTTGNYRMGGRKAGEFKRARIEFVHEQNLRCGYRIARRASRGCASGSTWTPGIFRCKRFKRCDCFGRKPYESCPLRLTLRRHENFLP